jgi:carboxyl-terminal processing protease
VKDKHNDFSGAVFNRTVRLKWTVIACVVCIIAAAAVTALLFYAKLGGRAGFDSAAKYAEVEKAISDNYIGEYDSQSLKDAAAAAMVTSLGDKWSYYMTKDEYETYKLHSANEYAGIGVTVAKDDKTGGFKLTSVIADTPASAAGLKEGQVILTVDGEDVTKQSVDGLREMIQSKINSKIVLGVSTDGGKAQDYTVDCSIIHTNPVTYELKDGNIGYIKIANFDSGSGDAAIAAIEDLLKQGATSILFDVRDNPGGFLSELIKLLDYILPEGDLFVSVDQQGNETVTKSDNVCLQMNMAVLVNENTYSAAEFFAAALKEYNWAAVIGAPTTGKGRSQTTIELSDGSAVHISSRKYLTPKRVDLSEQGGITPDTVVYNSDDGVDAQLNKALNLLS